MTSIDLPVRSRTAPPRKAGKKETKTGGIEIDRYFTKPGVDVYDTCEWELRNAGHLQRERRRRLRAERRRDAEVLVADGHQRRRLEVLPRPPQHARPRDLRAPAHRPRRPHHHPVGTRGRLLRLRGGRRHLPRRARRTSFSTRWPPSTRRCGSTSASKRSRSARRASSTPSRTRWTPSSAWPRPRACSSSTARGRARTSPASAPRESSSPAAAPPPGPVSFMRGYDSFAGVIKSGGKTRRAAKMVILNADHPDIVDFIESKENEERKAWALIEAGYDGAFNAPGGAYDSVHFQNANHSVRVTDEFMRAVREGRRLADPRRHRPDRVMGTYKARDLMQRMAESAWVCGDPGMQFDTTVNDWHPVPEHGPHQRLQSVLGVHVPRRLRVQPRVAEPDEVLQRDHRLRRRGLSRRAAHRHHRAGDHRRLRVVSDARPSRRTRTSSARSASATRTSARCSWPAAFPMTAKKAAITPPRSRRSSPASRTRSPRASPRSSARSPATPSIEEPFLRVIDKHRRSAYRLDVRSLPADLADAACKVWDEAYALGQQHGYRNAQISVLAPTGTIAFMMDCDTTGIEPDIALVKYKKLVGGGMLKIVNNTVPTALKRLGYDPKQVKEIVEYINENDTIEGAPHLHRAAPAGVRLRLQARQRHALDPLHGPPQDDGRRAAVHHRRDLQDHQHAHQRHRRGDRGGVLRGLEARPQGRRRLPRRLQALAAAVDRRGTRPQLEQLGVGPDGRAPQAPRRARVDHPQVLDRRPRGLHHRRHVRRRQRPARSSSPWPRKARRSPA